MEKAIKKYFPVFVLPTLVAFTIGFIAPFLLGIYLSFCKFTTVTDAKFIGFKNYTKILEDSTFFHATWYTALFTIVTVLLINVIAFAVALLLTKGIKGTNIFRTVFFMPNLIGGIVLWLYLAAFVKWYSGDCWKNIDIFFSIWILGISHSDVLAADRLYDDHLCIRYSEYPGRIDRGCKN